MINHPGTKFIANGDELQNDPIEHNMNVTCGDYHREVIDGIFPHQIALDIAKRFKGENALKVQKLHDDIFIRNMPLKQVIQKYAKIVKRMDDIPKNICFVTYRQETRKEMNEWEHQRLGLKGVFEGLVLRANCHTGKCKKTRFNKHFDYKIVKIEDKTIDMVDESSGLEYKNVDKKWLKNFSFPYAFTGHSLQGATIEKPVIIFDTQFEHISKKWLYVALTRSPDFNDVYAYDGKPNTVMPTAYIEDKILGYIRQDKAKAFTQKSGDETKRNYINVEWVRKQSKLQMHRCSCCGEVMNIQNNGGYLDWTVDRISNDKEHVKNNCTLMCLHCNISKK